MHKLTDVALQMVGYKITDPATAALLYAQHGLYVLPLWWVTEAYGSPAALRRLQCACPAGGGCESAGKHPLTKHGLSEATNDPAQVAAWWRRWPHANVGLAAGLNGLAILDVDPPHGGTESLDKLITWAERRTGECITYTLTSRTAAGGWHYIFNAPGVGIKSRVNSFGAAGVGLDTRGRGGYIVAPPSRGPRGAYQYAQGVMQVNPWPAALHAGMELAYPTPSAAPYVPNAGGRPRGWAEKVLAAEAAAVAGRQPGSRSVALNRSAYKVGQVVGAGLLDMATAYGELLGAALASGLTEREAHRDVGNGLKAGEKQPRGPAPAKPLQTART